MPSFTHLKLRKNWKEKSKKPKKSRNWSRKHWLFSTGKSRPEKFKGKRRSSKLLRKELCWKLNGSKN